MYHIGDSDSTGSITGNILGVLKGVNVNPNRFLEQLELKDVIEVITFDIYNCFNDQNYQPSQKGFGRYPPN